MEKEQKIYHIPKKMLIILLLYIKDNAIWFLSKIVQKEKHE